MRSLPSPNCRARGLSSRAGLALVLLAASFGSACRTTCTDAPPSAKSADASPSTKGTDAPPSAKGADLPPDRRVPSGGGAQRPSVRDDADVVHADLLPAGIVARSTAGRLLAPMEYPPDARAKREGRLEEARAALERAPDDAELLVAYGRRLGSLGRFREAIAAFTRGIELHPDDARFWRHRGHRWISVHDFARARRDLEHAAALLEGRPDEPEPPSEPSTRAVEPDTLQRNVHYHLGLACWLAGDAEAAVKAWRTCATYSRGPDALCSVSHWLWCALRELGRDDEARAVLAPIRADLGVVENGAYHALLLVYRGEKDADALLAETRAKGGASNDLATIGYGLAHRWIVDGERERGLALLRETASLSNWAAFGCIAADAELARRVSKRALAPGGENPR